ncbi:hypothetical protein LSUE1_G004311, partial [Lachnellula suecica]
APSEFSINLQSASYPILPLVAQESGTLGNFDLVFQRPSAYTGTPAYFNSSRLVFDYTGTYPGIYAMHYENVGDNYGATVPVTAIFGQDEGTEGLSEGSDGTVQPARTAALQGFFACNVTLGGDEYLGLRFGVPMVDGRRRRGVFSLR